MNLDDILKTLPSKEDLAKAIGVHAAEPRGGTVLTALGIFGTGMLIGASLAILLAPRLDQEVDGDTPASSDGHGQDT